MRRYRKILHISYKDHLTNVEVRAKIQQAIGPQEYLLTIVKRRKLQWYGHVSRSLGLAKTILQGTVKEEKKTRRKKEEVGRQHQGMNRPGVRLGPEGSGEHGKIEKTGCRIICCAQTTLAVKGLMMMMCNSICGLYKKDTNLLCWTSNLPSIMQRVYTIHPPPLNHCTTGEVGMRTKPGYRMPKREQLQDRDSSSSQMAPCSWKHNRYRLLLSLPLNSTALASVLVQIVYLHLFQDVLSFSGSCPSCILSI